MDLVREAQSTVDHLNAQRDELANAIDSARSHSSDAALAVMLRRAAELAGEAGWSLFTGRAWS